MKQGKNPTRRQRDILKRCRLNPDNWLVVKFLTEELHVVNRQTRKVRIIRY